MDEPTAIKECGTEWYHPAVKTAMGPRRLPHSDRQPTRYLAIKEARRIIREAEDREGSE